MAWEEDLGSGANRLEKPLLGRQPSIRIGVLMVLMEGANVWGRDKRWMGRVGTTMVRRSEEGMVVGGTGKAWKGMVFVI